MTLPIPFPGASKNVLLVGDEGVSIYNVSGGGVRFIDQLTWLVPDFEAKLVDTLKKDCPKASVVVLYDMVEQHYRKEMVPKVGFIDKQNVINRKVAITFPNYKMRAALELKAQKHNDQDEEGKGLKGSPFLFAAVPSSELLSSLLRSVIGSGLSVSGLYLLPVEGVNMISRLLKKLPNVQKKSGWTLFMGQHASGSLRQIVVRNGELALTRMTPFSESQNETDAWVQGISQEYKVTISYLSRLGYKPEDGINVVIIGPDGIDNGIEEHIQDENTNITLMNIEEASNQMGLKLNQSNPDDFADILYVAWMGQTSKYKLPLPVESFDRVTKPRLIANLLMVAGLAGAGWFGYQSIVNSATYFSLSSDLKQREAQLLGEKEKYAQLLDEQEKEGYDIRLYKGAFAAQAELDAYTLRPFTVLKGVSKALGPVLSIDDILIRHGDQTEVSFKSLDAMPQTPNYIANIGSNQKDDTHQMYSRLSMTFSSSVSQVEANRILTDLVAQMQARLPEYKVNLEKAVRDRSYEVDVEGQIGAQRNNEPDLQEDNTAVIEIRGAVAS